MKKYALSLCLLIGISFLSYGQNYKYPFQNPALSMEERVSNLVSQMTLEEKVAQMINTAPAIPRLDVPAYDWWNEVLHGVARTSYKTTVYPQAIAMAATFDVSSLHTMAEQSATEGRAIFNDARKTGKEGQRYIGLTYWTPNINIFRDPRWGRGQETYGEDPFLTGSLGESFVNGLQGNDPKYLHAAACAKHYAVHSGPEPLRHVFNVSPSYYDLWDTYLPAFKRLVTEADVAGVMCAYNAYKTQPCCASDELMNDILRNQWKFTGYVTSDCWAIDDFFRNHKTHPDAESASADAVIHGTDVECGSGAYKTLVQAVKDGKISEKQIDVSLKRLFMIRFRLGMFDPDDMVPFSHTPLSELESDPHKAHALKMAQQSIVLLRNENHTLPLRKNLKKIVVLGPNADNAIAILGNYNGTPSKAVTALEGIKRKLGNSVNVVYEKGVNFTNDTLLSIADLKNQYSIDGKKGVKAEYFSNTSLNGDPIAVRIEPDVNHDWQEGENVIENQKAYDFSARYTTDFTPERTGVITFEMDADDNYRISVDGKEKLNAWNQNRWGSRSFKLNVEKGKPYHIVIEYKQLGGMASIHFRGGLLEKNDFNKLVSRIKDADAIVFVGGISPQLEGEEMRVNYPGFNGGDRTSILLPKVQTDLMKALKTSGKPVIFVMMTGSAIAAPWEAENIPAIVNAWYGGQSAGTAIADVLFGDYNPAGRLPITFYKSDKDLPNFEDYSMKNRTYRYFTGTPLYPFGYGLSYTKFAYEWAKAPAKSFGENDKITCTVKVKNTGDRDGDEVVQAYIQYPQGVQEAPLKELRSFSRIPVKKSADGTVQIEIPVNDLKKWDDKTNALKVIKGEYKLFVGSNSADSKLTSVFSVN